MKDLIKSKSIGWYICSVAAILALVMAIIVFATQSTAMPNGENGISVGIVLLIGVALQAAVTFFPVKFASWGSVLVYSIAFGLLLNKVPTTIADVANGVKYAGGSFEMCMFYSVAVLVIALCCIVGSFFAQTNNSSEKI